MIVKLKDNQAIQTDAKGYAWFESHSHYFKIHTGSFKPQAKLSAPIGEDGFVVIPEEIRKAYDLQDSVYVTDYRESLGLVIFAIRVKDPELISVNSENDPDKIAANDPADNAGDEEKINQLVNEINSAKDMLKEFLKTYASYQEKFNKLVEEKNFLAYKISKQDEQIQNTIAALLA